MRTDKMQTVHVAGVIGIGADKISEYARMFARAAAENHAVIVLMDGTNEFMRAEMKKKRIAEMAQAINADMISHHGMHDLKTTRENFPLEMRSIDFNWEDKLKFMGPRKSDVQPWKKKHKR